MIGFNSFLDINFITLLESAILTAGFTLIGRVSFTRSNFSWYIYGMIMDAFNISQKMNTILNICAHFGSTFQTSLKQDSLIKRPPINNKKKLSDFLRAFPDDLRVRQIIFHVCIAIQQELNTSSLTHAKCYLLVVIEMYFRMRNLLIERF